MYLTRNEVAERLRIHVGTVDRMISDGRLKAVKNGEPGKNGSVRISEEALAEYDRTHVVSTDA